MKYLLSILSIVFIFNLAVAQETLRFKEGNQALQKGLELYDDGRYALAREYFASAQQDRQKTQHLEMIKARYYEAMCALKLFHNDAVYLSEQFINNHSESSYTNNLTFELALFHYANKEYKKAVHWFQQVNTYHLSNEESAEWHFKLGYAAFRENDTALAKTSFYEIVEIPSKYHSPAVYYYSHIHYSEQNYLTALKGFEELQDDETFGSIVPYYIIQINYKLKEYDKVTDLGPSLLKNVTEKREAEVARIIGEAYYHNVRYDSALHYLEIFYENATVKTPDDLYLYAYVYYAAKNYDKAALVFEEIADASSSLGQNASYHLADCYLKLNNKKKARMAFYAASKGEFDPHLAEESMFQYALLTYELSVDAFNEVINAFQQFLEKYPNSSKQQEAQKYLLAAYINTNNYTGAYEAMQKIKVKSPEIKKAYQKVAFHRGVEFIHSQQYNQAVEMFNIADNFAQFDASISARSKYWKAEAFYRLGEYLSAIDNFRLFLETMGAFNLEEYNEAHYNLGYCYFKRKEYTEANSWFRKYEKLAGTNDPVMASDAFNRIADCYFIQSKYWPALDYYAKAVDLGKSNPDYSKYQLGFTYSLVDRNERVITELEEFIQQFPTSVYHDDALFHLGRTYSEENNHEQAEKRYKKLIRQYPANNLSAKAQVNLGLIYYNQGRDQEALGMFKRTVNQFAGTNEAKNALIGMKNIYIDSDNVDTYFDYVKGLGSSVEIKVTEQDSLTFVAAENVYLKGNCGKAVNSLENYLRKFQDGSYRLEAQFYLGDCYYQQEKYDEALLAFDQVLSVPETEFTEQALLVTTRMLYERKNYQKAIPLFQRLEKTANTEGNKLEAQLGLINSYYTLKDYEKVAEACERVLSTPQLNDILLYNVRFKYGKALFELDRYEEALEEFRYCSDNLKKEEGAESKYRIAQIFYFQDKWPKAEQVIYDYVDKNTPHQYWLAKSFLLLAEIFMNTGDEFQANHTLNSVIDNYDNRDDGIYTEAWDMKRRLKAMQEENQNKEQDPVEIEFND
ncbi:MAG: tetratricopeptide repeat protein [Bacteroidetes bacterium]|jgi:tetratricopeptide (TPR) repeat protein|nr:tetratricopeptide repeat protein [Bacteroidota bacterium]